MAWLTSTHGEAADEDCVNELRWRPNDWGFSEFRWDYPAHFAAGKTTAMLIFGGADTRVAEPKRSQRHDENKRKNTREENVWRSPKVGLRTRSETLSRTFWRFRRPLRMRRRCVDAQRRGL